MKTIWNKCTFSLSPGEYRCLKFKSRSPVRRNRCLKKEAFKPYETITVRTSNVANHSSWQPIETAPENILIDTKVEYEFKVGVNQYLIKINEYWMEADKITYVYYTPTHWRPIKRR